MIDKVVMTEKVCVSLNGKPLDETKFLRSHK